jgi:hypothetical protein
MSNLTIVALAMFGAFVVLAILRFAVKDAVLPLSIDDVTIMQRLENQGGPIKNYEVPYQEVLGLGDVTLEKDELVLAACGQRGQVETVLLATDRMLYFFTRRAGASHYLVERFDYGRMRPIPLGGAVIGEKIRVMEGDRLAEMVSPGAESWLDSAEDTIKTINAQIRRVRTL